jgi:hypothetical protein
MFIFSFKGVVFLRGIFFFIYIFTFILMITLHEVIFPSLYYKTKEKYNL